jgi:DNA-3-methyladenine glycosylase II
VSGAQPCDGLPHVVLVARSALSNADPVMAQLSQVHPDFDPRAFLAQLPTPCEFIDSDPERVHVAGLSKRKVETMRALAQALFNDDLEDDTLALTSDAEIEAKLTAIPGIGRWTVNGFLLIALDRPDVFPAGDLALRRAVRRLYSLDHLPSESELLGIAERWRPYRSLAAAYLFESEFG